ncbi:MAG: TRAP transporter substrate-binding protein DctP [Thermodesulfobacteriota bacterium]
MLKPTSYPANILGSPPEQCEQVRLGAIDMGLPTQGALDKYVKAFSAVMLPFIFDDYEHVYRTLDGPSLNWLSPLAEKEGFIILSNWEWGFRNLTNNKRPILKPEDVRGLKVRTPLTRMGIDPVHFGVVTTLSLMVGLLTPSGGWFTTQYRGWGEFSSLEQL